MRGAVVSNELSRRDLLTLLGVGGVVYASGLAGCAAGLPPAQTAAPGPNTPKPRAPSEDFVFLQLSDTHWGFSGPELNPHADVELKHAVATINAAGAPVDFVMFTGDLTHTTQDAQERRRRMREFKAIVSELKVPFLKFIPGEHDALLDAGEAYREFFGDLHYSFDHKGVHFVALDNVSDPLAQFGDAQLAWLRADLQARERDTPIVVFAHRPLWDLKPDWEWTTSDGAKALELLLPYPHVTVFFGHIHQQLHHETGHISHHAARSLMFAQPTPESPGKRAPIPWDPQHPEQGIGYRSVAVGPEADALKLSELPVA
jgi:hypothetical protein